MYDTDIVVGMVVREPKSLASLGEIKTIADISRKLSIAPERISTLGMEEGEIYVSIPDDDTIDGWVEYERIRKLTLTSFAAAVVEPDIEENGYTGPVELVCPELITTPGYAMGVKNPAVHADIDDTLWHFRKTNLINVWPVYGRGEGALIAQPDTGYTDHPELAGILYQKNMDYSFIGPEGPDARDQLLKSQFSYGHGTASASVLAGQQNSTVLPPVAGDVWGGAPLANVLPLRCVKMVARVTFVSVARAIRYALEQRYTYGGEERGVDVIYLCLGGIRRIVPLDGSKRLRRAIDAACDAGVIVIAAAGNPPAKSVVFPASLDNVIAVAATNFNNEPCEWSCHGKEVDISAPGDGIYRARTHRSGPVKFDSWPSWGTTYASTQLASAAAIWISYHGRAKIEDAAGGPQNVWKLFRRLAMQTANTQGGTWDTKNFGAGVLDAEALMIAPL